MILILMSILLIASVSADCGCLRCSKHLQGVDIMGPEGYPIKVVFQRPCSSCTCGCSESNYGGIGASSSYTPTIEVPVAVPPTIVTPDRSYKYKIKQYSRPQLMKTKDYTGHRYSASLQVPIPTAPETPRPLLNKLKYRVDTILYPSLNPNPAPNTASAQFFEQISGPEVPLAPNNVETGESSLHATYEPQATCSCCRLENNNDVNRVCSCQRSKRSPTVRSKRNLHEQGYNLLMDMLPHGIRGPLYHSIRGVRVLQGENREPDTNPILKLLRKKGSQRPNPTFEAKQGGKISNVYKPQNSQKQTLQQWREQLKMKKHEPSHYVLDQDLFAKSHNQRNQVDELTLLNKLKRLNRNPYSSNLEKQATDFMKSLLHPAKSPLSRQKRTIILSSDEIDLPTHYEVDMVSGEEDDEASTEYEYSPIVGDRRLPFVSNEEVEDVEEGNAKSIFRRKLLPSLPAFKPKPDIVLGKNVIQKAVREELESFRKQQERQEKLKQAKTTLQQRQMVPHNPIFMLLTAPMQFLRQFHDVNKGGVNPILTSLPKLVYTAKKYFRDFGKNFQKNCLNLASDIIGDFDQVQPNVIKTIVEPTRNRYKRTINPEYSLEIDAMEKNFQKAHDNHVRKKRYVIKVVDEDELQSQVENYLSEKVNYLHPFQNYYKFNEFVNQMQRNIVQAPLDEQLPDSVEDKPKTKKLRIRKVKPKVIIDNKGLPFMEYDGYKRPLFLKNRKSVPAKIDPKSSENTGDKIASLIARFKEDPEVVGMSHRDIPPPNTVKEHISNLLEEINHLVHLNPEDYDDIFETLIRTEQIKQSIEQDWKRLLIGDKIDDIRGKIELLSKFKELQHTKDNGVKVVAKHLANNENDFVRRLLINSLIRLQKLQCLVSSVVDEFEQHLRAKTPFSAKKEIKLVDYLSGLNIVYAKTRNDLVRKLRQDRDVEAQKKIEMLNKLKKLMMEPQTDKFDRASKLLWEIKNLEKLQKQTITELNRKLARNFKIRKELRILFDLQKQRDNCELELNEELGGITVIKSKIGPKKSIKDILAEIKQKNDVLLKKTKEKWKPRYSPTSNKLRQK